MRRRLWLLVFAVTFPLAGHAENHSCASDLVAKIRQPYFWTIEKDGVTSYALGTLHAGVGLDELPPFVAQAVQEVSVILSEAEQPAYHRTTLASSLNSEDLALAKRIAKARFQSVPILENSLGTLDVFTGFLLLSIHESQLAKILGYSLDRDIKILASGLGKEVRPLDDAAELESAWNGLSAKYLRKTQDLLGRVRAQKLNDEQIYHWPAFKPLETTLAHYRNGETAKLLAQSREDDELDAQVLTRRNRTWVDRIEDAHSRGGGFAAGGLAHFLGSDQSVLSLLKNRGFRILRAGLPSRNYTCLPSDESYRYMLTLNFEKGEAWYKPYAPGAMELKMQMSSAVEYFSAPEAKPHPERVVVEIAGGATIVIEPTAKSRSSQAAGEGFLLSDAGHRVGPFTCF